MSAAHMAVLYSRLVLLGLSLIGPGLAGAFRPRIGLTWLIAEATDAKSHLRGLNAMMAALGMVALWAWSRSGPAGTWRTRAGRCWRSAWSWRCWS